MKNFVKILKYFKKILSSIPRHIDPLIQNKTFEIESLNLKAAPFEDRNYTVEILRLPKM